MILNGFFWHTNGMLISLAHRQDTISLTGDRAEKERMKAEILRLAEAMSEDSDEEGGAKALDVIDLDDDLDGAGASTVKIPGDGEDSGDEEGSEERGVDPIKPETILELAYIRDPKLFDRDAQTRRSKPRTDLKQQTGNKHVVKVSLRVTKVSLPGWTDEQIEGWRIMLERNVSNSLYGYILVHKYTVPAQERSHIAKT